MTIQANQGFGVSVFGAVSGGGGGSTSPGGSSGQIQYNNSGAFGGLSQLTFSGGKINVVSAPFGLSGNISSAAWTTSGIRYANSAATLTDTSSTGTVATAYTDLFGGNTIAASNSTTFTNYYTSWFNAPTAGTNVTFTNSWALGAGGNAHITGNLALGSSADAILRRAAAATLQLGAADAAAPVAQTFKVQGVVAGTSNTAGANFTIQGSQGTGTGAGGGIIFQVAPAGSSGTAQNAYATALTIAGTRDATFAGAVGGITNLTLSGYVIAPGGLYYAASGAQASGYDFYSIGGGRGHLLAWNSGSSAQPIVAIGGTTASFPALKRSTTTLQVRLADDTAFAPLNCGNTTASGTALDVSGTGAASIFNVVNTTTGTLLSVVNSSSSTIFSVNDAAATGVQVAGISFGLTGNISAAAWTTNGIRYRNVAATLTDTSSSGTVATAYTDVFGGNTIAASSSTTYTNYATFRLAGPTAGTNVTFTNSWALSLGGSLVMDDATNIAVGTTTGTKIGTATSQKIGFWNAAPIAQPTTGVAAATVAATGAGDVVAASTTFDGYTIPQIVKAMRNAGLLA